VSTLTTILVPAALFVVAVALVLGRRLRAVDRPPRPWWESRAVWVGLSAAVVLVGIVAVPRLLGFTFVLLPLIWMRGLGGRGRDRRGRG
jgi:energy-converting hydrogenase Eha subunit A